MSFNNKEQVNAAFVGERLARSLMLPYYPLSFGLKVVDTNGNRDRDIICTGIESGKSYAVEEKFIQGDFGEFCIEILQDMLTREPGWFYTTKADILMYVACVPVTWKPIKAFAVRWPMFKAWWPTYLATHHIPKAIVSSKGYGLTLNLAILWQNIPKDICTEKRIS